MQNNWYPNFQPSGYFGGIINAILGRNTGKFKFNNQYFFPLRQGSILIDTSPGSLMKVAMSVPHLNTVLSTGAELFSLMEIKHIDKKGEEIPNSPILKFLKNPNPIQSREQYLYEFYIINGVYNKTFQHKIMPFSNIELGRIPKAIWLLPSGWMKINVTGKVYRQTDINEIIKNYEMIHDDTPFEVEKIIYMSEGVGNDILNPASRIEALQIPLSNIVASLKSRNIIISERGMIGFIAPEAPKDSDGMLPFSEAEAEKVRKKYQEQQGLDSQDGHVHFTHAPLRWVPMTFDVKQLDLSGGMEDDFGQICNAFRHDRDIYSSTKGATFENKSAGMKSTIQNGLQPLADKLMNQLTKHFLDENTGEQLIACYDHLPAMQEDELKCQQAEKTKAEKLQIGLKSGIISREQFATDMGWELDGDEQFYEPSKQPKEDVPAAE